jgi:hypothetical protein
MPRKEGCPGSGDLAGGADEPEGTVQYFKCGRSFLRVRTSIKDGVRQFLVPDHDRRPLGCRRGEVVGQVQEMAIVVPVEASFRFFRLSDRTVCNRTG